MNFEPIKLLDHRLISIIIGGYKCVGNKVTTPLFIKSILNENKKSTKKRREPFEIEPFKLLDDRLISITTARYKCERNKLAMPLFMKSFFLLLHILRFLIDSLWLSLTTLRFVVSHNS